MPLSLRSEGVVGCCGCSGGDDVGLGRSDAMPQPRGCTDLVWLICFVLFCCVLILIAAFALVYGNPKRLINGMDSFGNVCGTQNEPFGNLSFSGRDMTDKPHVFYFNLHDMNTSMKICVSKCPEDTILSMTELKSYYLNTTINYCRYDFEWENWTQIPQHEEPFDEGFCPKFPIYSSHPVLKRCVPKLPEQTFSILSDETNSLYPDVYDYLNGLNIFKQILGDLSLTWVTVLGLTGISFVASIILVVILHWITTFVAYLILILSAILSVAFSGFLWWTYVDLKSTLDTTHPDMILSEMAKNESTFLTYSIVSSVFTAILLLIVLVIRKRVTIVVKLFREAGSALMAMPCLLIQPFITYAALTSFFCIWLYIILCIATSDNPAKRKIVSSIHPSEISFLNSASSDEIEGNWNETMNGMSPVGKNKTLSFEDIAGWTLIEYSDETWVKYMWWFYIIGLIWCSEFILACQQMVIASSISTWYFTRSRGGLRCVVFNSITRMIQYHIGSIALGSLIITLIKIPRLILQFCHRLFRKWDEYKIIQCLNRGCICCLKCFENGIKYVHHNTYTVISIQGTDFCQASKLAFSALVKNPLQISVINSIGDFVLFLAKCIVAALTGLISIIIFRHDDTLYFYAIPVLLTVIFSYFVAHCVISVFEMAVDTLFLCFCEDYNMYDGTDGNLYAPRSLLQYMTVDAVDAVAPGRRQRFDSPTQVKKQVDPNDVGACPEEIIPMNPYGETTAPNN